MKDIYTTACFLHCVEEGCHNMGYATDYMDGWLLAYKMWETNAASGLDPTIVGPERLDTRAGFDLVVEAKRNGILAGESKESRRGYNDALQVFQEMRVPKDL